MRSWLAACALAYFVVGSGGCVRAFGEPGGTVGAVRHTDGGDAAEARDSSRDVVDGPQLDHAPPSDMSLDLSRPDAVRLADAAPSEGVVVRDATIDAPSDLPHLADTTILAPCNGTLVYVYASNMAMCRDNVGHTQCNAAQVCNAAGGWSLCTAAQYQARGGATTARTEAAWIAGCIRNGNTLGAPSNTVCSNCAAANAAATPVGWRCGGTNAETSNNAYIGLVTYNDCRRVGVNQATTQANWRPAPTTEIHDVALCCR